MSMVRLILFFILGVLCAISACILAATPWPFNFVEFLITVIAVLISVVFLSTSTSSSIKRPYVFTVAASFLLIIGILYVSGSEEITELKEEGINFIACGILFLVIGGSLSFLRNQRDERKVPEPQPNITVGATTAAPEKLKSNKAEPEEYTMQTFVSSVYNMPTAELDRVIARLNGEFDKENNEGGSK